MKEKEYRNLKLISYSSLSELDKSGPKSIINPKEDVDIDYFSLGKYVEELIENGKKNIRNKFIITNLIKPTAMLGELAEVMLLNNAELKVNTAFALAKSLNLWKGTKDEAKYIANFDKDEFWGYLKLKQQTDKVVISYELANLGERMAKGVLNGEFTKNIYKCNSNQEIIHQLVILWGNKKLKSMLDFIKIDHKARTVTPYDLKTTGFPVENFIKEAFYRQRYYIQASMYTDALTEWVFDNYPDYTVKPFSFIVVSKLQPDVGIVYTVSDTILKSGVDGFYKDDILVKKGYKQLLEEYNWYVNNNKFELSMDTYINKGNILIE